MRDARRWFTLLGHNKTNNQIKMHICAAGTVQICQSPRCVIKPPVDKGHGSTSQFYCQNQTKRRHFTMTATHAMTEDAKRAPRLFNHAFFSAFVKPFSCVIKKLIHTKYAIHMCLKMPSVLLHSGRTDGSGGHNNRVGGNGAIPFHFHHTLGPHLPCCRSGPRQAAFIVNPYTGRVIALGTPYVYENQEYYSVNLVAKALTVWDTMGASLGLIPLIPMLQPRIRAGGSFSACNQGESAGPTLSTLGERFSFTYPTWPLIGSIRNNTFFVATGNRDSRLRLLCHTTQAELDPAICYAYISLETLREYMLEHGFFTSFAANMPANVWHFTHDEPLARITSPSHNESFHIGEVITVKATIQDVREATLYINDRAIETKADLTERDVVFSGYSLTDADVGNLNIRVVAQSGQWITVNLPPVRIRVAQSQVPEPYVWLVEPYDGGSFNVGDTVRVGVFIEGITHAELRIGDYRQVTTHPFNYLGYNFMFDPYTFTVDDVGGLSIAVTGTNSDGQTVTDAIHVQIAGNTLNRMMENLANDTTIAVESSTRRSSMVTIGQGMLDRSFEPAFVAGMLGNVMAEGSIGEFERVSNHSYLQYVLNNHDYANRFAGRFVYNMGATLQELYDIISNRTSSAGNNVNLFGLGTMQFTNGSRILHIVENYMLVSGGGGNITRELAAEAEIITLIQQLEGYGQHTGPPQPGHGWGFDLYAFWKTRHAANFNTEAAARDAAQLITRLFLRPGAVETAAEIRGNNAVNILRVMMQ